MLNSVSFGQFYPTNSVVHRLDPRTKLLMTVLIIASLFIPGYGSAGGFIALGFIAVAVLAAFITSKVPLKLALRSVSGIVPIIVIMGLLNIFYSAEGTILVEWWIIKITTGGLIRAFFMTVRIILLIISSSLLTYTTSPIDLTDGIERLLSPLNKIHVPVHDLAMIMTIALRFIPTLMEEADKIMSAQKARGADIESGGLVSRIKALIPILIPLFVSAVRRATELATAMDCRCYCGGEGRTRMKQMKLHSRDFISMAVGAAFLAAVICLNILI